jgi:hypothetical protein
MDDLSVTGKTEEEFKKHVKYSDDIHMEFGDLTSVQWLYERRKISSLGKFNTGHEQRNTWGWTRKNMQVPKEWEKWKYTIPTDERNKERKKKEKYDNRR